MKTFVKSISVIGTSRIMIKTIGRTIRQIPRKLHSFGVTEAPRLSDIPPSKPLDSQTSPSPNPPPPTVLLSFQHK